MSSELWQITWFTVAVAAGSTALILPGGLALAWLLARRDWPGKSIVETLVALPLVIPPVATGLLLLKLFGRRGPVGEFLENTFGWQIVFNWRGVVLATAIMSFPLLVRTARVAFESVNPRFEYVARSLGAGPSRVFATITLPLAFRGIVAGIALAFARALGEFGATIMVAGYIPGETATLSLSIYHLVQLGRDTEAFALLGLSLTIAFAAVWLGERFLRKNARA
jgi:molybdate ABC transporter, permease protein